MLPDGARSGAVLIGTSRYWSPELADLPAVAANLDGLRAVLTDPVLGWLDPARCVVVEDAIDVRAVYRTLRARARTVEDTLLVYFAGHGRIGQRNELYLGLADTDPDELTVSAFAYDHVREVMRDSPATNRIVILDCCFSGRAVDDMAGDVIGQLGVEGTYVLAATPPNAVALAPLGAKHTAFTGMLLELLTNGLADVPSSSLSLSTIHQELLRTAARHGLPRPQQRGTGTSQHLALVRNAATVDRSTTPRTAPARGPARTPARRRRVPWRAALAAALAVAAIVAVVATVTSFDLRPAPRSLGTAGYLLAQSPEGRLAIGGRWWVEVWDADGELVARFDADRDVSEANSEVAISTDGKLLAVSMSDVGVLVYDIDDRTVVTGPIGGTNTWGLSFNSDGTLLAMDAVVWDLRHDREVGTLPVPELGGGEKNRVTGAAFHPTDPDILALQDRGSTRLWNVRTSTPSGEPLADTELDEVGTVQFSADGSLLSANGRLWSMDRRESRCPATRRVIALSPDGRTAAVRTADYTARLFDTTECAKFGTTLTYANAVAFRPDNEMVAVVNFDETRRFWVRR